MKKMVIALFSCMSLATLGMDALETSQPVSQEPLPTKEVSVEKHCERGPRGHRGHRGHHGKHGKIGPQGPAGTSAAGVFGEAYLIPDWIQEPTEQYIVPNGTYAPVQFTFLEPLSSGITYNPLNWTFTVNTTGTYTIEYSVKSSAYDKSNPLTLNVKVVLGVDDQVETLVPFLNALDAPYAEAANQITRVIPAGTTIQLQARTLSKEPAIFIYGISGDKQEAAYISIEKIGD